MLVFRGLAMIDEVAGDDRDIGQRVEPVDLGDRGREEFGGIEPAGRAARPVRGCADRTAGWRALAPPSDLKIHRTFAARKNTRTFQKRCYCKSRPQAKRVIYNSRRRKPSRPPRNEADFRNYRRGCAWLRKQVGADLGDLSFGTLRGGIKFRTGGVLESSHIGARPKQHADWLRASRG
jgi:hypothetical protein